MGSFEYYDVAFIRFEINNRGSMGHTFSVQPVTVTQEANQIILNDLIFLDILTIHVFSEFVRNSRQKANLHDVFLFCPVIMIKS